MAFHLHGNKMLEYFSLENVSGLSVTILCLVGLSLLVRINYIVLSWKCHVNLPPGPRPYPVLGNILDIKGKELGSYFDECRRQYGDVFCLRFFRTIVIVFNGYDVIKEALVDNSHLFSSRPKVSLLSKYKERGLVMSGGERWKANRRFSLQILRDFGMGRNMLQLKIHEEVEEALLGIENYNGKPFDIKSIINCAVTNIIFSIAFGKRYSYDSKEFLAHSERMQSIFAAKNLFFIPSLFQYIPGDPFGARKLLNLFKENTDFYRSAVEEHIQSFDETNIRDFIDAYIKQMKTTNGNGAQKPFNQEELQSILADLHAAGSETTATAIKWGVVYLSRDRGLQTRIFEELEASIPQNRLPAVGDKLKLPLLEATVSEVLRLGNIVPFSVPHTAIQDCTFRGFNIPKEALIFPNLQSVLYDKDTWKNPEVFRPSRFLTKEGSLNRYEQFIPFSTGKRACLGESLARMELFLFISSMIQRFEFLPPEGEDPPSLDAIFGITRHPKPFLVRAIKRQR